MATALASAAVPTAQRQFKAALNDSLTPTVHRIAGLVVSNATSVKVFPDGQQVLTIPVLHESRVLSQAGDTLQRFFVGQDFRQVFGTDGVTALSPYAHLLNQFIARVTGRIVKRSSDFLKERLPEDVQRYLLTAHIREQFSGNPFAQYESAHTWVDPRGYRLSDRIWQTSIRTRTQMDGLLSEGIRSGRGAFDLAKELERFLLPERALLRTDRPYGRDASYHALNLARTEIGRAGTQASFVVGLSNPYVDGFDFALSAQHPKFDICDRLATIGMHNERLRPPYPVTGYVPKPFVDTHPQCLCVIIPSASKSTAEVVEELRDMMRRRLPAPITPIDPLRFIKRLLGGYLASLVVDDLF